LDELIKELQKSDNEVYKMFAKVLKESEKEKKKIIIEEKNG